MANSYAGAIYKRRLEFSKAIAMQSKAKDQWPRSVNAWSELGESFYSIGDYENETKVNEILLEL